MINQTLTMLFHLDVLAAVMMMLVSFIGLCVGSFAYRYMKGDSQYISFFIQLILLISSILVMVSADHLLLLFSAWCMSSILLVRLMIHKSSWKAAQASGKLAAKNYLLGALCVAAAFTIFYWPNGETSIQALIRQDNSSSFMLPALILLFIGAMTQSAIYPFHRWLTSSLNSPTPASAIMHAGLVNGGGFLLTRFAPLYLKHSNFLTLIFVVGIITAMLGTLWKLVQNDVKRMLACSTMGQMGFMLAQCGLGLFPAAVAHLVWHGMFKAYLFLASGSTAQEKRFDLGYPPKPLTFVCALICGAAGSFSFAFASDNSWLSGNSTLVIMVVAFLAAAQFSLSILRAQNLQHFLFAFITTGIMGLIYGGSVRLITESMEPMHLMQPQSLNGFYIAGIIVMTLAWLSIPFIRNSEKIGAPPVWMLKNYVAALNASQPHPDTVTVHRNNYRYL